MAQVAKAKNADIYNVDRRLRLALGRLDANPQLSGEVKETLRRFVRDLQNNGLSKYRQIWYLANLSPFAEDLGEAFLNPTLEDIKRTVGEVEGSDLEDSSKANRRVALKRFYKWHLGDDEEYPACVRWVKTTAGNGSNKLPEDLPTREEVQAIIDGAINPRDKALVALLADGGLRIGEALNLRVKDFHDDQYGGYLIVPGGKTGARRVRLVDSVPYLISWLRAHPLRKDGDAFLFIGIGRNRGEPLKYHAARKTIREAAKRGGVDLSKVNPHNFRHYAGTRLAKRVPEAPLEAQMGWVPGSKMSKVYVHLSGRDVDEAILRAEGIPVERDEVPKARSTCPRCQAVNPPEARFCFRCSMALTPEAVERVDAVQESAIKLLMEKVQKLTEKVAQLEARP